MAVVEFQDVDAGYGPIQILWGVSFAWAPDTRVLRLTGANGAGKTTLMKVLSGLVVHSSGRVLFEGDDIGDLTPQQRFHRGLTLVPEGRELFVGLTVEENLKAGLRSGREWNEASEHIFEVFPALVELRRRRVESLSGGQQQMVAVGRGMASRPSTLLLDEPYAGLAPRVVEAIDRAVVDLAEGGTHVLIVEEERTVDRTRPVLYMRRGRIEAPAGPESSTADSPG